MKSTLRCGIIAFLLAVSIPATHAQTPLLNWIIYHAQHQVAQYNYEGGLQSVNLALKWLPQNARLYTLRGEIYLLLYEWDNALNDFNQALTYQPDYPTAYFQRGVLYYTRAQRPEAHSDFERYLLLAPDGQFATFAQQALISIAQEQQALGD